MNAAYVEDSEGIMDMAAKQLSAGEKQEENVQEANTDAVMLLRQMFPQQIFQATNTIYVNTTMLC